MVWLKPESGLRAGDDHLRTMVTAITGAIHYFFSMRQRGLERVLEQLFEQAIWPRVGAVTIRAFRAAAARSR